MHDWCSLIDLSTRFEAWFFSVNSVNEATDDESTIRSQMKSLESGSGSSTGSVIEFPDSCASSRVDLGNKTIVLVCVGRTLTSSSSEDVLTISGFFDRNRVAVSAIISVEPSPLEILRAAGSRTVQLVSKRRRVLSGSRAGHHLADNALADLTTLSGGRNSNG